jgi:hypothetical protein
MKNVPKTSKYTHFGVTKYGHNFHFREKLNHRPNTQNDRSKIAHLLAVKENFRWKAKNFNFLWKSSF